MRTDAATETTTKFRSPRRFLAESLEGLVLFFAVMVSWPLTGRWLRDWGSTRQERARHWPGDELTENPVDVFTRAVSVDAGPEALWPWIVQFGLGRAGFYSYELLERTAGIPVRNIEQILPQHQVLQAGDEVKLHPKEAGIPVAKVVAPHCLCFGVLPGTRGAENPDPRRSWSLYVEPRAKGGSRLVVRSRIEALRVPTLSKRIGLALEVPIDFLMEQRMLRTIRRLVESTLKSSLAG